MADHHFKHERLPFVLIILDGWGLSRETEGNPLKSSVTPYVESLWVSYPHAMLEASGESVGLPHNEPGNSEAGHLNIGAGRIVVSDSVRVTKTIADGTFFQNPAFKAAIHHVKKHRTRMHVMGILPKEHSTHSDPQHLYALIDLLQKEGVERTYLHIFTDGRDSPPHSASELIPTLQSHLTNNEVIATIAGRFYLNRKKQWDVTKRIYDVLVDGDDALDADDPEKAVADAYKRGETDQFIKPTIIAHTPTERRASRMRSGDSIIFFNLRSDRARQITKPFVQKDFQGKNPGSFEPMIKLTDITFVAMSDFGPDLGDILTAFPSEDVVDALPMVLKYFRQLYIAETEKYAHVTYFFNGGYTKPVAGEERVLIPSPDIKHYDERPEMSSNDITDTVVKHLREHSYDVYVINFAAPDMIAHTGNVDAAEKAVHAVDGCVKRIVTTVLKQHGTAIVTADHGNVEEMVRSDRKEAVDTQHSRNPVPFILVNDKLTKTNLRPKGILGDIAPTIVKLLDLEQPKDMTGRSLW